MSALPWLHKLQIADMKSVKSTQHELKASTTWTGVEGALTLARAAQRVRVVEGPVLLLRRGRGQRGRSIEHHHARQTPATRRPPRTGVEGALALARAAQRVRVVEGPVLLLRRGRGQRGRSVDWLGRKQLGSFSSLCTPLLSELPSKSGRIPKP